MALALSCRSIPTRLPTMASMTGNKQLTAKLRRLSDQRMVKRVGKALFAAGERIQVEAQNSITAGSQSGENHKPSEAPDPPNNNSGVLANNIETVQVAPLVVDVSSRAPYAAVQEFGSSKQEARPYMRPAAILVAPEVSKLVADAASQEIRKAVK